MSPSAARRDLRADARRILAVETLTDGWGVVSREVADKVGPCWGLGSGVKGDPGPWQGELRNMWKPTAQEALWFHGGNLALSRFYSKYVALQIKAIEEGLLPRGRPKGANGRNSRRPEGYDRFRVSE